MVHDSNADREPRYCPFCGGQAVFLDTAPEGWHTYSIEDPANVAVLSEHQCATKGSCYGRSFWT